VAGLAETRTSRPAAAQHLRDLARLRRARDRIDREYAQSLDVEALACGAHMSAGHFSRQFRRAYGESPYGYLMTRRIEHAMALLRRGDLSVTEVCFAVACSSRAPSALASPNEAACRQASIGATRRARRRDPVVRRETGDRADQESRSADPRAAASVTAMDIAIHASFLPHDDPDASLAFYRDRPEVVPVVLLLLRAGAG
jgi:AraC-like DNA-binding protein